jgi:hypothetical protein
MTHVEGVCCRCGSTEHICQDCPSYDGFRIGAIHAYVSVGEDDQEGIIGENIGGSWLPFIAADEHRLIQLRPIAERIAKASGRPVRLVRFSVREDIEVIEP